MYLLVAARFVDKGLVCCDAGVELLLARLQVRNVRLELLDCIALRHNELEIGMQDASKPSPELQPAISGLSAHLGAE